MTRNPTGEIVRLQFADWMKLTVLAVFVVIAAYSMHYEAVTRLRVTESKVESLERTVDKLSDKLDLLRHPHN